MPQNIATITDLFENHGFPVTVVVFLYIAVKHIFGLYIKEVSTNQENMKRQIDELAAENRAYRILFLKKMGLSETDLENIFPAYKTSKIKEH